MLKVGKNFLSYPVEFKEGGKILCAIERELPCQNKGGIIVYPVGSISSPPLCLRQIGGGETLKEGEERKRVRLEGGGGKCQSRLGEKKRRRGSSKSSPVVGAYQDRVKNLQKKEGGKRGSYFTFLSVEGK